MVLSWVHGRVEMLAYEMVDGTDSQMENYLAALMDDKMVVSTADYLVAKSAVLMVAKMELMTA